MSSAVQRSIVVVQIVGRRNLGALVPERAAACQRLLESAALEIAKTGLLGATVGPLEILLCVDDPARAVEIATSILHRIASDEVPVCCAVHTGDVELRSSELSGREEVSGPGLWIARELAGLAGEGQVLITDAACINDSGLSLQTRREDLGERALCGRPTQCWLVADRRWHVPVTLETPTAPSFQEGDGPRPAFLGREEEREGVVAALTSDSRALAVVGAVGMGKSALLEVCLDDLLERGFDAAVVIYAAGDNNGKAVLGQLELELELSLRASDPVRVRAQRIVQELEDRGRTLIVIHDAEGLRDAPEIVPVLLRGRGTAILMSSTASVPGVKNVPLGPLDDDDAIELFLLRLRDIDESITAPPDSELIALVDRIGHSPLSLEIAASEVAEVGLDVVMKRHEIELDARNSRFAAPRRPLTLRAAVSRQWHALAQEVVDAVLLLAVFVDEFSARTVHVACGEDDDLTVKLGDNSLILRTADGWRLHAPVRSYALEQLRASPKVTAAVGNFVRHVASDECQTLKTEEIVGAFDLLPAGEEVLALALVSVAGPKLTAMEEEMVFLHLLERLEARKIEDAPTLCRLVAAYRLLPDRLAVRKTTAPAYVALQLSNSPVVTAHLRLSLARVHGARGEYDKAREAIVALRHDAPQPALIAEADLALGRLSLQAGDWQAAQRDLFAAFAADSVTDGLQLVEVQRMLARAMVGNGQLDVAAVQLHGACVRSEKLGHVHAALRPNLDEAILLLARNDLRAAVPRLRTCTHLARISRSARGEALVLTWSALAALANGNVGEASRRLGASQGCAQMSPSGVQKLAAVAGAVLCAVNRNIVGAMDLIAHARELGGYVSPATAACLVQLVGGVGQLLGAKSQNGPNDFGLSSGPNGLEARAASALIRAIATHVGQSDPIR